MIDNINVLSLFDGIATGRYVLEKLGIKVDKYYAAEIERSAIKIAKKNFPDIIEIGDVTKIDFKQFNGKIDLLIGGSPCQNLSCVGDRTGLSGEKSRLFFDYIRALNDIKPQFFLLENNASMTDANKNRMSKIIGCQPILINSADFSAQDRKRYYWTNIPVHKVTEHSMLVLRDILEQNVTDEFYWDFPLKNLDLTKRVCAHWDMTGELEMNKRIYNVDFKAPTIMTGSGRKIRKIYDKSKKLVRSLTPLEYERLQNLPDNYTQVEGVTKNQRYAACGNGWTVDVIAHILKGLKEDNINDDAPTNIFNSHNLWSVFSKHKKEINK